MLRHWNRWLHPGSNQSHFGGSIRHIGGAPRHARTGRLWPVRGGVAKPLAIAHRALRRYRWLNS